MLKQKKFFGEDSHCRRNNVNHNKYDIQVGEEVIHDKGTICEGLATVIFFTPNQLYARVKSGDHEWVIMTYRLSPKEKRE